MRRTVTLGPDRKVVVQVCLDGHPPRRFWCPPPHTARSQRVVKIDRGENFHGSLVEEYYLIGDDSHSPNLFVLWLGTTGSQDDDDQARLNPVAWASYHAFCGEAGADRETALAVLLSAWVRAAAAAFDGYYQQDDVVTGQNDAQTEWLTQVFLDALNRRPFRRN